MQRCFIGGREEEDERRGSEEEEEYACVVIDEREEIGLIGFFGIGREGAGELRKRFS